MSAPKPTLTKAQMNQLLNCQDTLKSSFQELATATKKLNQTRLNLEKEAAGETPTSRGSTFYNNIHNEQALKDAHGVVKKLIKQFGADMARIEKNIGFLNSQTIYERRMSDLTNYYRDNISQDRQSTEAEKSKRAIANRMTTYYSRKDESIHSVTHYMSYIYWIVFALIVGVFCFSFVKGGYLRSSYETIKAVGRRVKGNVRKDLTGGALSRAPWRRRRTSWRSPRTSWKYPGKLTFNIKPKASTPVIQKAKIAEPYGGSLMSSGALLLAFLLIPKLFMPVIMFLKPLFLPYA